MVEMHAHAAPPQVSLPNIKSQAMAIPPATATSATTAPRPRQTPFLDTYVSPVNQNGSFEFDRVIKSGYVQRRTQKTKVCNLSALPTLGAANRQHWKSVFLVLRPNILSVYKTDKEDKLRHKVFLSELTAVTFLRDPKHKREHLFGLFSPSQNYYFQAASADDAQAWVDVLRDEARIDEEEEEMLLASPEGARPPYSFAGFSNISNLFGGGRSTGDLSPYPAAVAVAERERMVSSSPEPQMTQPPRAASGQRPALTLQHPYSHPDALAWSGNEMGFSDYSDGDVQRMPGVSSDSLGAHPYAQSQSPPSTSFPSVAVGQPHGSGDTRNISQTSGINLETDPDRVIWQGWLWLLRSKGGVRQWKDSWAVLRPRNLILYKDETEYAAQLILPLSAILSVVERDPLSRTKKHCLQVITDEKSYRFSAHDEETLVRCLGAFKSLLAKRRELEKAAALTSPNASSAPVPVPPVLRVT